MEDDICTAVFHSVIYNSVAGIHLLDAIQAPIPVENTLDLRPRARGHTTNGDGLGRSSSQAQGK